MMYLQVWSTWYSYGAVCTATVNPNIVLGVYTVHVYKYHVLTLLPLNETRGCSELFVRGTSTVPGMVQVLVLVPHYR